MIETDHAADSTEAMPAYLDIPFQNRQSAFVRCFLPDVSARFAESFQRQAHGPLVHIMNASGYGKTKLAMQIGSIITSFFIRLGIGKNGSRRSKAAISMMR